MARKEDWGTIGNITNKEPTCHVLIAEKPGFIGRMIFKKSANFSKKKILHTFFAYKLLQSSNCDILSSKCVTRTVDMVLENLRSIL